MASFIPVSQWREKYGYSQSGVYNMIYTGRIPVERTSAGYLIPDSPPAHPYHCRSGDTLDMADPYILALLWHTCTISGDRILVRHQDAYFPMAIHTSLGGGLRTESGRTICAIGSRSIIQSLLDLGFSGKKDASRVPPPVPPDVAAQAFLEAHGHFRWHLSYARHAPGDKRKAYYVPRMSVTSSPAIVQAFLDWVYFSGIGPQRTASTLSNGSSSAVCFTSRAQLSAMHNAFVSSPLRHTVFWDNFSRDAEAPPISYDTMYQFRQAGIRGTALFEYFRKG